MSIKHSIVKFKFEDFAGLTEERGTAMHSRITEGCNGNFWMLAIYPRGDTDSPDDMVEITLYNKGSNDVSAGATFIVRDAIGKVYADMTVNVDTFKCGGKNGRGYDMIKRSDILNKEKNILADGALHVDVHIEIMPEQKLIIVPPSPLASNMLRLLDDTESADVQFEVERTVITAHKLILKTNAPLLYEFCKGDKEGEKIQIKNVTPDVFRIVLRYVYAGELPDRKNSFDNGRGIIEAADRLGIIPLKMAVESGMVRNLHINRYNVTEYLIFAESKTCSFLKEAAISYFVARATDLLNSKAWEKLGESPSLLAEIMKEMSKRVDTDTRFGEYSNLSVNELRKRLADEELDIDGSKESLVSRLQESAKKKQRTE